MNVRRSARANIAMAMVAKILSMGVAVLSVPLLLSLLGTQRYGTWVTLTSLITFISLLDLGVGNSIRNSVATLQDSTLAEVQAEFTGFFQLLGGVALLALAALALALPFSTLLSDNRAAAVLLYAPSLLLLPLLIGANVLQGAQATGLQAILQASAGGLFFLLVLAFKAASHTPSLQDLALAWSLFYAAVLVFSFRVALRVLHIPLRGLGQWALYRFPKQRLRLGLEFLGLQLSSLVLYGLGNALVFHQLGANDVARYDVLNKVFQVVLSFYTIVIGVMWSEIARHRAAGDALSLQRSYRRLLGVATAFSASCLFGAGLTPWVIDQWTGHRLQVSAGEALAAAALVSLQSIAYVGAVFMNAFEQIRTQVVLAGLSILFMIPLSTLLIHLGLGIAAVPVAASALTLLPAIFCNHRARQLVRSTQPTASVAG
jgi:O-antigen/teichoic acid export membrane protein